MRVPAWFVLSFAFSRTAFAQVVGPAPANEPSIPPNVPDDEPAPAPPQPALPENVPPAPVAMPPPAPEPPREPPENPALVEPKETAGSPAFIDTTWNRPPARLFLSTEIDVGVSYGRPRVAIGYGLPHRFWGGIDFNPILTTNALGAYGGVRFASPVVDLRVGGRYFYGLYRSYLPIQESYTREDIDFRGGSHAQYWEAESELTLNVPVGPGSIVSETALTRVWGVPDDRYVYEETIHVVAAPPYIWRQRLGYVLPFLRGRELRVGAIVEVLGVPERDDGRIWRGGLVVRFKLFDDLELRANLVPVIASPDNLGIAGGDFGEFGVRWRWATGP